MPGDSMFFNLYADGTKIEIDDLLDDDVYDALRDAIMEHFGKYAPAAIKYYQVELTDGFLVAYSSSKRIGSFSLPPIKTMIGGKEYTVEFYHYGDMNTPKSAPKKRTTTRKASNCPPEKVLNPATGRCVSRSGKAGKAAAGPAPKTCPEGKVLNPATGRCVSRSGKAGKATAGPKTCPEGKVLNPKTGRCVSAKRAAAKTRKLRR